MAINVEGHSVPGQFADRQQVHAQAQQERWLYQLEQAMLLQDGKKPGAAPAPERDRATRESSREVQPSAEQSGQVSPIISTLGTQTISTQGAFAEAPHFTPAASEAASAAPHAADAYSAITVNEAASRAGVVDSGRAASVVRSAAEFQTPPGLLPDDARVGNSAPASLAIGIVRPFVATGGQDLLAPVVENVRVAATASSNPALPAMAPRSSPEFATDAAGEAERYPANRPAAPPQSPGDEDYTARLLHVYHDPDGVQAWIRDAAIDQVQARTLAQAMADELAASGTTLVALTLNGRKLALPAESPAGANGKFLNPERNTETRLRSTVPRDLTIHGAT